MSSNAGNADLNADLNAALIQRFEALLQRMELAALASQKSTGLDKDGKAPKLPDLLAVSKFHPAEAVAALAKHWDLRHLESFGKIPPPRFGENYVQEALLKQKAVSELAPDILTIPDSWHFSGHLQSNKAKDISGHFELIHTIDSEKLARILHKILEERIKQEQKPAFAIQKVLIQINIGEEPQKSGVLPKDAKALATAMISLPGLSLQGLMCLPPAVEEAEEARPYFARMRQVRDELEHELGIKLPCLSMGMSDDLEIAIEEGASLIRVGTDIFGPRPTF